MHQVPPLTAALANQLGSQDLELTRKEVPMNPRATGMKLWEGKGGLRHAVVSRQSRTLTLPWSSRDLFEMRTGVRSAGISCTLPAFASGSVRTTCQATPDACTCGQPTE